MSDHAADGHGHHHRPEHLRKPAHELRGRIGFAGLGIGLGGLQAGGQSFHQLPLVIDCSRRPLAASYRDDDHDSRTADGASGCVGYVKLGNSGQLGEALATDGVDVGLGCSARCERYGELATGFPVDRPRALEHLREVAKQRQSFERIVVEWTGVAHEGMVGPCGPDLPAWSSPAQPAHWVVVCSPL